jgi:c-di-GMP-binding flagellar brake protein YcgR
MSADDQAANDTGTTGYTLVEPADYSQYLLHGKTEVLFVLQALRAAADRVTLHFNDGKDFLLSTIVAVDDRGITLDFGSDPAMNQQALAADKLFCATSHDKVRVQFMLRGVTRIDAADGPAFHAALPDSLLRLQRREYYRLTTPIARPLKCQIPLTSRDGAPIKVDVSIIDISGGGLAIMVPPAGIAFEEGMQFRGCRIELPEVGFIVATLEVRNLFEVTLRSGGHVRRAGCQFLDLPGSMLTMVQRYIVKVERERKARETGLR